MLYLYIYDAADFTTGLPSERFGAANAGTPISIRLRPGATGQRVLINDTNDTGPGSPYFNEDDDTQTVGEDVTLNGLVFPAGSGIYAAYDLLDDPSNPDMKVTSFHIGYSSGLVQGPVDGLVATSPLEPGRTYNFYTNRSSYQRTQTYEEYVSCFTNGTLIETDQGQVAVEHLRPGSLVRTTSGAFKPVRLCLRRDVSAREMAENHRLRPVKITAGALGDRMPRTDLWVSRQHRMVASSPITNRMFGQDALIAAIRLAELPGIYVDETRETLSYFHLVFDSHELILANGAPTESYLVTARSVEDDDCATAREIRTLFPELNDPGYEPQTATLIPPLPQQKSLIRRHLKNRKPLLTNT